MKVTTIYISDEDLQLKRKMEVATQSNITHGQIYARGLKELEKEFVKELTQNNNP